MIAEEDGLIVDKQGGFCKLRGCRDQILSMILLAQTRMSGGDNGMFAIFVDFCKVYDRVNKEKLLFIYLFIYLFIILYSHRTVTDGLTPQAGVAITEGLTGGEKDGV